MSLNYGDLFRALLPEAALVAGAILVLGVDMVFGRGAGHAARVKRSSFLAFVALAAAGAGAVFHGAPESVFGGALRLDELTMAGRVGVLVLSALAVSVLTGNARLPAPAEFNAILLFATSGFTLMAAADQMMVAFLAIELASLSLYVMAGFDRDRSASAEAALKYFLFGGMSAAFLLFGFSLLYGLTGALTFPAVSEQLRVTAASPLLIVAMTMVLVAFGFKAAAAPFHLWAPDVYQGAPGPAAALIASASKLAGFILFMRLLWSGLGHSAGHAGA
jgi:NADH-quinone oxidoreductase subunit N